MNPALDITTSVDVVRPTEKMRCGAPRYDPGGGGINVARIVHVLGGCSTALFPAGGSTGSLLMALLGDAGVPFRVIPIAASTRESFTVNESRTAKQYRFVLPGPSLTVAEQEQCLDELRGAAASAAFVVASGSAARCGCRLLSAGCRHLPPIEHSADPGYIWWRVAAHFVRGVSSQGERAGTARVRRIRTADRARTTGRRTRTH